MKNNQNCRLMNTISFFSIVCSTFVFTLLFVGILAAEETNIEGIGKFGPAEKLHSDFQFTEGPASDQAGNLYFTDIPANRIYKLDANGNKAVFIEPSGHANGLMIDGVGNLVACQMDGQVVSFNIKTKEASMLAKSYMQQRFNAPNDLVIDKSGGVYFTDPHYRAPMPLPQRTMAVYYRAANGFVSRLIDDLDAPNGVILSPDEKTLYVIPSQQETMMAYPVESPGVLGDGKVFCKLKQPEGQTGRGGDGLTMDEKGNLYITSGLGLQVVSPEGKMLGLLEFPEQPANVTFGGAENKTLFVTARTSLYKMAAPVAGHRFTGKASE